MGSSSSSHGPLTDEEFDSLPDDGPEVTSNVLSDAEFDALPDSLSPEREKEIADRLSGALTGQHIPQAVKNAGNIITKGAIKTLPALGGIGGGFIGAFEGGVGAVPGAFYGGTAGAAMRDQLNTAFYPEDAPKEDKEYITGPLMEGLTSAAGEGVTGALAKGSSLPKELLSKITDKAAKYGIKVPQAQGFIKDLLELGFSHTPAKEAAVKLTGDVANVAAKLGSKNNVRPFAHASVKGLSALMGNKQ